ncbi:hypothetical protein PM082_012043 [Marasmius tenuissimus]|nr:hypothetical protein PM082_012043 [Marasmius tenuissimus]
MFPSNNFPTVPPEFASISHRSVTVADRHVISQLLRDYEFEVKSCEREVAKHKAAITSLETRKNRAAQFYSL